MIAALLQLDCCLLFFSSFLLSSRDGRSHYYNTGSTTALVSGLQPDTLYAARITVTNVDGTANGSIAFVTTLKNGYDSAQLVFDADFTSVFGVSFTQAGLFAA